MNPLSGATADRLPPPDIEESPPQVKPTGNHVIWIPGYWVPYQAGWIWTPARYVLAASGCVFVPGYWDHNLYARAQLFAPIRVRTAAALAQPLRATPAHLLDVNQLQLHLFVRAGASNYFYGDYYDARYAQVGMRPWHSQRFAPGLTDPLLGYTTWSVRRTGIDYVERLMAWNKFFLTQETLRPAVTLAGQRELARTQRGAKNLTAALLSTSLDEATTAKPEAFVPLSADEHAALIESAGRLQVLGRQRLQVEGDVADVNLRAVASQAIQLPIAPLAIPPAVLPTSAEASNVVDGLLGGNAARAVPVDPAEILQGVESTLDPVENVAPRVDRVLPRLPF
ncbi:MAG: hypothetical protein U0939_17830 [Pirellulales bacterium]